MDSMLTLAAAQQIGSFASMFGEPNWLQIIAGVLGGGVITAGVGMAANAVASRTAGPREIATAAVPTAVDTKRWEALPVIIGKLTKTSEPTQIFKVILESVQEQVQCEYAALLILRAGVYHFEAGIGLCEESRQAFQFDASNGLIDFMRTKGQSVALNRNDRQLQEFKFLREPISEVIITPMRAGDNIFALLFVANKANMGTFSKGDFDMMSFLAPPFALALFQAISFKRAQGGVVNTIVEIVKNHESCSPYCEGHSERVAALSVAMGRELHMNAMEIEELRIAAMLHDLGKFSMAPELRFCEVPPEGKDREAVLSQDKAAITWLRPLGFIEHSLPLILHHHERYDGSGFPSGMRGPAIPIGAMIIAVAETFDLLTHDLPDRAGRPAPEIKAFIESQSSSKFDPQVIRAFLSVMEKPKQ